MSIRGDSMEGAILTTLSYLDVFSCAPTTREIHRFLIGCEASRSDLERVLGSGGAIARRISSRHGFWALRGKEHLIPRRIRFLEHSRRFWPQARRIAERLERTGLASSAMVTGSLAADNSDEHADIDFLLTYPPERAWTSWALVRLAVKLPGAGLRPMCANYALPDDRLEIRPQNLFTAWEIAKAVPLFGFDVYERFVHANAWVLRYLPNALPLLDAEPPPAPARRDPPVLRALTGNPLYQRLEAKERRRKFRRDTEDVGVDMEARLRRGSLDRHTPTRSFQTLSELRYRMESFGLEAHPLFPELKAATELLGDEMGRWGEREILPSLSSSEGREAPKTTERSRKPKVKQARRKAS